MNFFHAVQCLQVTGQCGLLRTLSRPTRAPGKAATERRIGMAVQGIMSSWIAFDEEMPMVERCLKLGAVHNNKKVCASTGADRFNGWFV